MISRDKSFAVIVSTSTKMDIDVTLGSSCYVLAVGRREFGELSERSVRREGGRPSGSENIGRQSPLKLKSGVFGCRKPTCHWWSTTKTVNSMGSFERWSFNEACGSVIDFRLTFFTELGDSMNRYHQRALQLSDKQMVRWVYNSISYRPGAAKQIRE